MTAVSTTWANRNRMMPTPVTRCRIHAHWPSRPRYREPSSLRRRATVQGSFRTGGGSLSLVGPEELPGLLHRLVPLLLGRLQVRSLGAGLPGLLHAVRRLHDLAQDIEGRVVSRTTTRWLLAHDPFLLCRGEQHIEARPQSSPASA